MMTNGLIVVQGEVAAHGSQDVWSACVLLFMMTTGSFPWHVAEQGDEGYDAMLTGTVFDRSVVSPWSILQPSLQKVRPFCCVPVVL
jgi:hypothetical protein